MVYACASQRIDGAFVVEDFDQSVVFVDEMVNGYSCERFDLSAEAARILAQALNEAAGS